MDTSGNGSFWDKSDFYGNIRPASEKDWENPIRGVFMNTWYIGTEMSGLNFIEDRIQDVEDGNVRVPELKEVAIEGVILIASKAKPIAKVGTSWLSRIFKPDYVKKGTRLAEKLRQSTPNGTSNPTIFKNGKPRFRVHKSGEHGASKNESVIDVFEEQINPNNGRRFNKATTQKFDRETYRELKKASKQNGGYDARTKNGKIIN